jgi:NTP pyrophosphatase (non-canonical NTP hydrolase)
MSSYAEIEMKILQWAEARLIVPNAKPHTQLLKLISEAGELCDAEIKGNKAATIDGVGDVMVCLVNYCALKDISIVDCMYAAYKEIKDRKGTTTPDGVFIKQE